MLDVQAVERAEKSLDEFINSRSKDKDQANAEAALQRAADLRRLQAQREDNRAQWCDYYRRLAACNIKAARDYRRRARELAGEGEASRE